LRATVSITNVISAPEHSKNNPMTIQPLPPKRFKELDQLCQKLGVTCGRMGLVNEALTHSSYAAENPGSQDYEKLEFFGDAVLKFVISEYLLERFPDYDEGQLTELRAVLVSDRILAEIGEQFNLSKYILLGRNVQTRPSITANAMEALIGAIYQDLGLFQVQTLLVRLFGHQTTVVDRDEIKDNYKAQLQEFTQSRAEGTPSYVVVSTDGPPHDPIFTVVVKLEGKPLAEGTGKSKKAAEQDAAKLAFQVLQDPTRSVLA